jgi:hypothetical protein
MVSRPRGSEYQLAINVNAHFDFHLVNNVILPIYSAYEAHSLQHLAYGLPACLLTLKESGYPFSSKKSLPGGWPSFSGRDLHPLEYTTLPSRTNYSAYQTN